MVDVKKRKEEVNRVDRFQPGSIRGNIFIELIGLDGSQCKTTQTSRKYAPVLICISTPIVCPEKGVVVVVDYPAKNGGVICSVGQETCWLEIQSQGGRTCFGWCRLCDIVVGRSKKGSGGGTETTSGRILRRV